MPPRRRTHATGDPTVSSREQLVETSREAASEAWRHATGEISHDQSELAQTIAAAFNGVRCAILAAITEPAPPAVQEAPPPPPPPLATWGYLELMGHRVIVGWVEADELEGRRMLRVRRLVKAERKPGLGEPEPPLELEERWRLFSPAAVYSFEPIDEQQARERWLARGGIGSYSGDEIPF